MKTVKIVVLFIYLFFGLNCVFGQIFVKDSYVYVADNYLYVKDGIELNTANSNLYLRNGAQLLQGASATVSTNKGTGSLSVFQEGTSNNFAYNYWSSPVGESLTTAGNSPFSITQLGVPTSSTTTTVATALDNNFWDGFSTPGSVNIARRYIYNFISSSTYAQWLYVGIGNSNPGYGFTMKGVSGTDATTATAVQAFGGAANNPGFAQRYDFRGKPNDGVITVTIGAGKQTLTGNPYPSAIDLQLFYNLNSTKIESSISYWEQPNSTATSHYLTAYKGGYGVYNAVNNLYVPAAIFSTDQNGIAIEPSTATGGIYKRKFAPVGQGFMITGKAGILTNSVATFDNNLRVVVKETTAANLTDSEFHRVNMSSQNATVDNDFYGSIPNVAGIDYTLISKAPTPNIRIATSFGTGEASRQVLLVFKAGAIDDVDASDSKSPDANGSLPQDMYIFLNNSEYVMSGTTFDINKKFAVGFKNTQVANYKMKVQQIENFNGANAIYLHDKVNDLYYDIKNASHEFSMPAGANNTKYEITFTQGALSNPENTIASFDVFQNNVNSVLTIRNPKLIDIKNCELFDMTGKLIFNKTNLGSQSEFTFQTANLSQGVYIVNITTSENQKISKKVIVAKAN